MTATKCDTHGAARGVGRDDSPDLDARMVALTWEQWEAAFAWERKEPALVVVDGWALMNGQLRPMLARLREKVDGLTEAQTRGLSWYAAGGGYGGPGGQVLMRSMTRLGFAKPDPDAFGYVSILLPMGRAALHLLGATRG